MRQTIQPNANRYDTRATTDHVSRWRTNAPPTYSSVATASSRISGPRRPRVACSTYTGNRRRLLQLLFQFSPRFGCLIRFAHALGSQLVRLLNGWRHRLQEMLRRETDPDRENRQRREGG